MRISRSGCIKSRGVLIPVISSASNKSPEQKLIPDSSRLYHSSSRARSPSATSDAPFCASAFSIARNPLIKSNRCINTSTLSDTECAFDWN